MLHEFRLINVRNENNETISFVYGAKVFDPIGMLAPSTLLPKLLLQEIRKMKKAWDQELPQNIVNKFMKWFNEIQILKGVSVPRCMKIDIFTELHVFVDASKGSYAGCVFVRSIVDSRVSVILIRAKSRVAPLKLLSIPRLELMACCVGVRLVNSILKALNMPDLKVTLWSDSTTALWWIKEYGNWSVFVANRVKEIRELTQIQSWKRFIARRGRARIIYCDNGTNFRGAFNDLAKLDWHKISRETSTQKIVWKFIPPTAAWWGGWWERLVRIIKKLLRRSLGKSISVKSTKPEKVLNINDAIIKKYTSSGRLVKEPKRLDLFNYNCYRGLRLSPSLKGGVCCE
ncbi:integrase catalytic domain-containing protein [Trichonephila clavipes]|nr:integrase catalytic domain-containing protein [Trichonephila clavipes]